MRRTVFILILIHFYMLLVKGTRKQRESGTAERKQHLLRSLWKQTQQMRLVNAHQLPRLKEVGLATHPVVLPENPDRSPVATAYVGFHRVDTTEVT